MRSALHRKLLVLAALAVFAAACGSGEAATTGATTGADDTASVGAPADDAADDAAGATAPTEPIAAGSDAGAQTAAADSTQICETEDLVAAVEGGADEGTLAGMADDPVGTAASNNPVLTTLVAAASEAGLVDTLNSAEALTVFAPTDCAFAGLDPATLDAAMADPQGLLTTVLGFHVIPERLSPEDLQGMTELTTFTGEVLPISVEGDTISLNDGAANVLVPDVQTANATVYLIDSVMLPPSASAG